MLPLSARNGRRFLLPIIFLLIVSVVGTVPQVLQAQSYRQDLRSILADRPANEQGVEDTLSTVGIERVSEAKTLLKGTVRLYQATLSETDMHLCNFTPSCSRFAAASLQRYGIVRGSLLAADRLERCHGMPSTAQHYTYDPDTGRYIDPVGRYSEKKLSPKPPRKSK